MCIRDSRRTDGEQAGDPEAAGAEGTRELRLAQAQEDKCEELQDQAGAIENQVNGDEALEGELEGERPTYSADKHADPGHSATVAAQEGARQKAVAGHGDGQACVAPVSYTHLSPALACAMAKRKTFSWSWCATTQRLSLIHI